MILTSLKYSRFEGEPREWRIVENGNPEKAGRMFGNINLLVGKNAAGKSRTLSAIRDIARLLSGRLLIEDTIYPTERYEITFKNTNIQGRYILAYKKRVITEEIYELNGEVMFCRSEGHFFDKAALEEQTGLLARYKVDDGVYFSQALIDWADNLRDFQFTNQREKDTLVKDCNHLERDSKNQNSLNSIIYYFNRGLSQFGEAFTEEILKCMKQIGYSVTDIQMNLHKNGYGLDIEEYGMYRIDQREMSQGMFRALSYFIQLVYACMENDSICVLLDDIGEGLDSDRAKDMLGITMHKINDTNIQFFVTTNDRDIMNKIPLKFWTVIDRNNGNESIVYNYSNSKDIYEDFRYTGLCNFDFLASDFYKKGFSEDIDDEEEDESFV